MTRQIEYTTSDNGFHVWRCPGCKKQIARLSFKKWDSMTTRDRTQYGEDVWDKAELHTCK